MPPYASPDRCGSGRTGSDRSGSDRSGSDRSGSDRSGSDRSGSDRYPSVRSGSDRSGSDRTASAAVAAHAVRGPIGLPDRTPAVGMPAVGRLGVGEAEGLGLLPDGGFVLLAAEVPGPARRRVGTAVDASLGPQRVCRAGQRILVRADSGARPPARLGGLLGGANRLGGGRRRLRRRRVGLRRRRVGLRRDRRGGGRLDRGPVARGEAGLRMRARDFGRAASAVPAAPVITRVEVRQRAAAAVWPRCPAGRYARSSPAACRRPGHPRTARRKPRRTPRPATVPRPRRFPCASSRADVTWTSWPRRRAPPHGNAAPRSCGPTPARRPVVLMITMPGPAARDQRLRVLQDSLRAGEVDHGAGPRGPGAVHGPSALGSGVCAIPGGSAGSGGPGGSCGAGGPVRSDRRRRRGPASAGRRPAVPGPARRIRPNPGTARAHAEVERCRYADQSRNCESRDQDHWSPSRMPGLVGGTRDAS